MPLIAVALIPQVEFEMNEFDDLGDDTYIPLRSI